MDVKKDWFGRYHIYTQCGKEKIRQDPVEYAVKMQNQGAGEILLTAIHKDGTMIGYDTDLLKMITSSVTIPVIASGGAGETGDFVKAVKEGGASAVAAGSMVVYQGKNRAVLTKFPKREELSALLP